jgi:Lon protease-like protein
MPSIPLFPLRAVLFPHGRVSLQIFEARYLDMISHCLKTESGFGVMWLKEGSDVESESEDQSSPSRLAHIGSYASVVDWQQLPNGLLGVTIVGSKKFRLVSSEQQKNRLYIGDVEWLPDEPNVALPVTVLELKELLASLLEHPQLAALNISPVIDDVSTLSCLLAQLLPVPESVKFALLLLDDPMERVERIMHLVEELQGV